MNTPRRMRMLDDKDPATGEYRIPKIIYSDAYSSEMVAYADLVLPDTTYLERHDCISLLDRPISEPDGPGDAIRQPVVKPDRDVRAFQDVLIELGARLGLPAFVDAEGRPRYPATTPTTSSPRARARRRPAGRLARRGRRAQGRGGAATRRSSTRYIENGCFWRSELPLEQQFFKHANKAYQDCAAAMGLHRPPEPVMFQLYIEIAAEVPPGGAGHGAGRCRPQNTARASTPISTRCRSGISRSRKRAVDPADFPLHAITQRPMAMYHSWGSQNAWLRQIHGQNRLYMNRATASGSASRRRLGLGDRAITAGSGADRADGRRQPGHGVDLERDRQAQRRLEPRRRTRPKSRSGFLLNHLISELLPPPRDGGADVSPTPTRSPARPPGTTCACASRRRPPPRPGIARRISRPYTARRRRSRRPEAWRFATARLARRSGRVAAGEGDMTDLPRQAPGQKKLGLVIDLDICVGCHACATTARSGTPAATWRRSPTPSLRRRRLGRVVQPHAYVRGGRRRRDGAGAGPHRAFPEILPALRGAGLRHGLPDRRLLQAGRGRHRAGRRETCASAASCAPGPAPTARASSTPTRRHEEMHAVHRPHLQREPRRERAPAGLRADVPDQGAPFRRSRRPGFRRLRAGRRARRQGPDAGNGLPAGQQIPAAAPHPQVPDFAAADSRAAPGRPATSNLLRWVDRLLSR